jgi:mono/diheme cytochrome c family protein
MIDLANAQRGRLCALFLTLALSTAAQASDLQGGKAVYDANCAVCHGATGRPDADSPVVKGLGVVPADFLDPLFNSREPSGDWEMVVQHGGHAMGLAEQMPPQKDALSDEEIENVVAYVKSLADTSAYPPGEMNLFLPIRTKKAFPEDEVVFHGRMTDSDGENTYKNILEIEKRVGRSGQLILEFVHEKDAVTNELKEIEVGYKRALSWSREHVLSGAVVYAAPVDSGDGDGELQTYLAYGTSLSEAWILQGSLRFKMPLDKFSDGEAELAGITHYVHSKWPRRLFPALEVVAAQPFRSSNGDLEWTIMPQVRIGLTRGGHVALNLGVEVPLSDQSWDRRYYVTLLWDFADGGFFQGW